MVYIGPFNRIVNVNWNNAPPEPVETFFWMRSGEHPDFASTGVGADHVIPGTDPPALSQIHLVYVNPSDPDWIAICGVFVTSQIGSPTMQFAWTGQFLDERVGDPNLMPWLDGLTLTVAGYGALPPFGASDPFLGLFRQTYDGFRTTYNWTNFPDTGAIPLLPVSDANNTEDGGPEKISITYPGWEDYFSTEGATE